MSHPSESPVIDVGALRALAHPLRIELFEMLNAHGPATASLLGRRLGESSGATSYHLRQLARHGLIEEDPGHAGGRERWWRVPEGSRKLVGDDYLTRPDTRAAAELVYREWQRGKVERAARFLRERDSWSPQWRDATVESISDLRLTATQLHDLVGEVFEVVDRYKQAAAAEPHDAGDVAEADRPAAVELQFTAFPKRPPEERS